MNLLSRLICILPVVLLIIPEAAGQKIDRERTTVKYIQLPLKPLPESIRSYKTVFRAGLLMPDEKRELENRYLKLDGYARTQSNADLRIELSMYGINLAGFEIIEEEESYRRDGETYRYNKFFYRIRYTFPTRLDVFTDNCERYLEEDIFPDNERFTVEFGENEVFRSSAALKRAFSDERFEFFEELEERKMNEALRACSQLIEDNFAYLKTSERVMFITGRGRRHDYPQLDKALKHAERALNMITAKSPQESINSEFKKAIALWEDALKKADVDDKKAKINEKIAGYLHYNCAQAFMWMNDFNNARRHAVEASLNEKSDRRGRNIQEEIADREQRFLANKGRTIPD